MGYCQDRLKLVRSPIPRCFACFHLKNIADVTYVGLSMDFLCSKVLGRHVPYAIPSACEELTNNVD